MFNMRGIQRLDTFIEISTRYQCVDSILVTLLFMSYVQHSSSSLEEQMKPNVQYSVYRSNLPLTSSPYQYIHTVSSCYEDRGQKLRVFAPWPLEDSPSSFRIN